MLIILIVIVFQMRQSSSSPSSSPTHPFSTWIHGHKYQCSDPASFAHQMTLVCVLDCMAWVASMRDKSMLSKTKKSQLMLLLMECCMWHFRFSLPEQAEHQVSMFSWSSVGSWVSTISSWMGLKELEARERLTRWRMGSEKWWISWGWRALWRWWRVFELIWFKEQWCMGFELKCKIDHPSL